MKRDFLFLISPSRSRYSVNPMEVADLHVITYEVERDLIPLILSNCQYSIEKGREALEEFDLEKIQQQIISRFLRGKPLITLRVGNVAGWGCCFVSLVPTRSNSQHTEHPSNVHLLSLFSTLFSERAFPHWCTGMTEIMSVSSVISRAS